MAERASDTREFVRGAARFGDLVYIISKGKKLLDDDIAHTSLVAVDAGDWADAETTTWDSTALAVARAPAEKVVLVGEEGDVVAYVGGKSQVEAITPPPVMIRNAREIGGLVHACGMKRQVYRRDGEKRWVDISAPRAADDEKFGFESIDGFAPGELYAVGWGGEIWRFDGQAWTACGSPTNVILTAVCCAGDGVVYLCGQGGVMISGRGDAWAIVDWEEEVTADLWDLCWFGGKLYVATMSALYTLDGDALEPVDFGEMGPVSCYCLSTAEGVLWSVGKADVASFDGTTWRKYD